MPTVHVTPGSDLLQDIANALHKAKKVVVVTGAGISTNSGIPDFRSENGLYSLIQAQFDAASEELDRRDEVRSSPPLPEERPTKRRKLSNSDKEDADDCITVDDSVTVDDGMSITVAAESIVVRGCAPGPDTEHGAGPGPLSRPEAGRAPSIHPGTHSSSTRASTPRALSSETSYTSSSPLSSPPPILSDPYENSLDYSRTESVTTDTDSSGTSTPLQSKTTLPNLKGRDLFDASIWADPVKTSVFYTFATTLRQKARDVTPTTSHLFLGVLRDQRKLVRCYTQNIDRLEDRIGLSTRLELGAGSRSRFSAKAWRHSVAAGGQGQGPGQKGEPGVQARGDDATSSQESEPGVQAGGQDGAADRGAAEAAAAGQGAEQAGGAASQGTDQPAAQTADQAAAVGAEPVRTGHPRRNGRTRADESRAREDAGVKVQQGRGLLAGHSKGDQPPAAPSPAVLPESSSVPADPPLRPELQPDQPGQSSQAQTPDEPDPGGGGGLPPRPAPNRGVECVFLHGSLESLRCFLCGQTCSWDDAERELETLAGRQPTCPHCAGATAAREERGKRALGVGKLRPDIVLYGEEHPKSDMIGTIVQHDLSLGPDMLLILGTSLRVHGLKTVVREFAKAVHSKGGKVVFVNFTKPPDSVWSDVIDYWVQSDCDAWVDDIKTRKPALWLPPGTTTDEGKRCLRRASTGLSVSSDKGKRKSNEKLQRTDSLALIEEVDIRKPPSRRLPDAPSLPADKEVKLDPNAKRPQSTREELFNGAYLSWKILEDLKRLTAQPKPCFVYSTLPPPVTKAPRAKKLRQSAPAVVFSGIPADAIEQRSMKPDTSALSGPLEHPSVRRLPVDSVSAPVMPSLRPVPSPLFAMPLAFYVQSVPTRAKPTRTKKAPIESEEPAVLPTSTIKPEQPAVSPTSIGAAIKSNPRKRKRKTIDGVEVVLPGKGRRHVKPVKPVSPRTPASSPARTPQTPHIVLPAPRPSLTPRTPRPEVATDLERFRSDPGLELPRLHDAFPPPRPSRRLTTIEPQPLLGPVLPTSNGPHKLGDFFLGGHARQRSEADSAANPFFLADPLSALSYPSRSGSPNHSPSDQLRSEAALTLSMMQGANLARWEWMGR